MRRLALIGAIVTVWLGTLLGPVPASAGGGCHAERATEGSGDEVVMSKNCFEPSILRAPSGTTVSFLNDDLGDHTVTGQGGWGTGDRDVAPGEAVEATFSRDGIYLYVCLFHPSMVGAVVVGDPEGPGAARGSAPTVDSVPEEPDGAADETVTTTTTAAASSGGLPLPASVAIGAAGLALGAVGFGLGRRRRGDG